MLALDVAVRRKVCAVCKDFKVGQVTGELTWIDKSVVTAHRLTFFSVFPRPKTVGTG